MNIRNERMLEAEAQLRAAKDHANKVLTEEQEKCKHKDVGETIGTDRNFKYGRVCLDCGLSVDRMSFPETATLGNKLVYKLDDSQYSNLRRKAYY